MKRILNSQAGFSIVQVLIAAGLMGGLALMMTKLGQNQAKMQRKAIEDQDLNQFVNTVQKHLLNHEACKNTFADIDTLNSNGDSQAVESIKNFEGIEVYNDSDKQPSPRLNIIGMKAIRGADNELKFEIEIQKKSRGAQQSYGAKNFKKFIELDALYSNGEVLKCYSQLDSAVSTSVLLAREEACIDIGAQWNSTTKTCTLTDAFKKQLIEDGLKQLNLVKLYEKSDGTLSKSKPGDYVSKCKVSRKRCSRTSSHTCGRSCNSGYSAGNWVGGRYNENEDPLGVNKKCMRKFMCNYTKPGIGSLVPDL